MRLSKSSEHPQRFPPLTMQYRASLTDANPSLVWSRRALLRRREVMPRIPKSVQHDDAFHPLEIPALPIGVEQPMLRLTNISHG
jgi:hypothetical protein